MFEIVVWIERLPSYIDTGHNDETIINAYDRALATIGGIASLNLRN
jgi:hypothetical protein